MAREINCQERFYCPPAVFYIISSHIAPKEQSGRENNKINLLNNLSYATDKEVAFV